MGLTVRPISSVELATADFDDDQAILTEISWHPALSIEVAEAGGIEQASCILDRDAVTRFRDAMTAWLERTAEIMACAKCGRKGCRW